MRANKFVWLGTSKAFDAFTFAFEETEHGWVWAHAYRFAPDCSTFIVECSRRHVARARLRHDEPGRKHCAVRAAVRQISRRAFADVQRDAPASARRPGSISAGSSATNWSNGNVILLGDAAHTAHFSIGSGTKLALEDAIKLAEVLNRPGLGHAAALDEYQAERNLEVLKLQNSARNSTEWFETLDRYLHFEPLQFAYSLLTRSQRISHENLRLRDAEWLEGVERWFWERAGVPARARRRCSRRSSCAR